MHTLLISFFTITLILQGNSQNSNQGQMLEIVTLSGGENVFAKESSSIGEWGIVIININHEIAYKQKPLKIQNTLQ